MPFWITMIPAKCAYVVIVWFSVIAVCCPIRYVLVLNVLTPDSLRFDLWGMDSRSSAITYAPSWAEVHVARVMREVWFCASNACNALHSSAAASVLILTGGLGMFIPDIG